MEKSMKIFFWVISIAFVIVVIIWHLNLETDSKEITTIKTVQAAETEKQTEKQEETTASVYSVTYYDVPLDIALQNHIFNLSSEYCINSKYIIAIIAEESAFNAQTTGDNGDSIGLMQIQSKWHGDRMKRLSCNDLYDPFQNITVGVDYLSELMNYYDGDIVKAIVAYQQGSYNGEITEYALDVLKIAASLGVKADV